METFWQDLRYGVRRLKKNPGFTAVAVLTLAMAIGANAVVFSLLNALILHPLNLPEPERLYGIERASDKSGSLSYPNYLDLRDRNRSFDALAAFNVDEAALDTGKNTHRAWIYLVTGNYFGAMGVQPYIGRFIQPSDEQGPNSAPYIVLSYACWNSYFQNDRGVVGRIAQLNKHPFTIVGVAPPDFHGSLLVFSPEFFVPLVNQEQVDGDNLLNDRGYRWMFEAVGRLKPGITPAQANADLDSIGSYLEKTYPEDDSQMRFALARPGLYGDYGGRPVRAFMAGLMLLAGLILLAACANLGNLFAARAADRSREVALRLALGATRIGVLRLLFTEALLISVTGGAVGLLGSVWLLAGLSLWQPYPRYPMRVAVNPDANVYVVALLLTLASGLLFGAVPVRQVLRADPYQIVKSGSLGIVGRQMTIRDLLLVGQIAISAMLITCSMVAVRGLVRSLHSNFGFDPRNVILADTDLTMAGYSDNKQPAMQRRMIDALKAIPGVRSVGITSKPPLRDCCSTLTVFTDETTDLRASNAATEAIFYNISPEYFQAAGTALLAGRDFTWHDDKNAPPAALINQEFARKTFGSATNAVGRYYKMPGGARIQVVGIVEDGKYDTLTEDPKAAMFFPISQAPWSVTFLVVRSSRDPQQLIPAIRSTLQNLDPGLTVYIQTWNQGLRDALFPARMAAQSLGVLGVMGAMLSVTGIFGIAAYSVSKRLKELGIRMASARNGKKC